MPADPQPAEHSINEAFTIDCFNASLAYWTATDGGRANGNGSIFCGMIVEDLLESTDLYRHRWYGWQHLDSDTSQDSWDDGVVSISIYRCAGTGHYNYLTVGDGRVRYLGKYYTATSSDKASFSC